jgi:hypothetical protein
MKSFTVERCAIGFQCGDLVVGFGTRCRRKCPTHGKQAPKLFNVLPLRFERLGRRIETKLVVEAERKTSGRPNEQDNDREGPQSGPENPAFRHRPCGSLARNFERRSLRRLCAGALFCFLYRMNRAGASL